MAYTVGPLTVKIPGLTDAKSPAPLATPDTFIPVAQRDYIDTETVAKKAGDIAGPPTSSAAPDKTVRSRSDAISPKRVAAAYLPNPLTLTPTSTIAKWVVLGALALYAYKSVKDGGVEVAPGRKRSIFIWVDVFIACFVGVYLLRLAREMF